jgi:hypothetical protein
LPRKGKYLCFAKLAGMARSDYRRLLGFLIFPGLWVLALGFWQPDKNDRIIDLNWFCGEIAVGLVLGYGSLFLYVERCAVCARAYLLVVPFASRDCSICNSRRATTSRLWSNALVCVGIPVVVCLGTLFYAMAVEASESDRAGDASDRGWGSFRDRHQAAIASIHVDDAPLIGIGILTITDT